MEQSFDQGNSAKVAVEAGRETLGPLDEVLREAMAEMQIHQEQATKILERVAEHPDFSKITRRQNLEDLEEVVRQFEGDLAATNSGSEVWLREVRTQMEKISTYYRTL